MMTSTSEMSGNASSGIRRKDQIPASTSNSVPVNTRKRFRAQQSIHRTITLHPSRGGYGDLFAGDSLAVFPRQDCDLPGSPASKLAGTFVDARSPFGECHWCAHGRHSHLWHGGHEEGHADLCTRDWGAAGIRELHAKHIAALMGRARI